MNDSVFFNDPDLNANLKAIYDSHDSPAAVLLEHDNDGASASAALRAFCESLPGALYIEGEAGSPYPFLVPCGAFFYAVYCAKERFDNFEHIDPNRVDKIAAALKIAGGGAGAPHPFDLITSFYGFKRHDPASAFDAEIYQQLLNILLYISEKNNIVFHIKNSDSIDEDSIALINYICRNTKNKKILFILSYSADRPAISKVAAGLNDSIFGQFKTAPAKPSDIAELIRFDAPACAFAVSDFIARQSGGRRSLIKITLKFLQDNNIINYNNATAKYFAAAGIGSDDIQRALISPGAGCFFDFLFKNLSADARRVVDAASIFHGDFRAAEISVCLKADEASVKAELELLVNSGVFYKSPYGEIYSFAHPLLSETARKITPANAALEYNCRIIDFFKDCAYELPNIALGRLMYHGMKTGRYAEVCIFAERLAHTLCAIGSARRALKLVRFVEIVVYNKKDARSEVTPAEKISIGLIHAKILILSGRCRGARDILLKLEAAAGDLISKAGSFRPPVFEIDKWLGFIYLMKPALASGDKDAALKRFMSALNREMSNTRSRIEITNLIALLHYHRSELEKASIFYRDSLKTLAMKKNAGGLELDSAQRGLSSVYLRLGEFRKALAYLKKCEELCAAAGNKKMLSNTYHYIGMLHHSRGEYPDAISNYEKAMEISCDISDILAQSRIQTSLGVTHFNLGAYKTSLSFFNQSMQVALNTGNKKALAILNGNTARIHAILNNIDAAFHALKEDMAVLNETGDLYGIAHASAYLGDVYFMAGDNPAANDNYLKSFEISKKSQFLRPLILSACGLINSTPVHLLSQQAQNIVNELILIDSREIDIVSKSMILRARCAYETASGTYHRATCFINQALINFEKMNMPLETGLCLIDEANIMLLNGLADMAEAKKKYAVEIFNKIGAKYYADKYSK